MLTTFEFTVRITLAFLLGAAIGIERQWRQKSAGLRTNTLVSMGAAAFILMSIDIGGDAVGRVASYVISGVGFLGAGAIMKDGISVIGLNTAATLWCSAAIGCLAGLGYTVQAIIVSAMVVFTHVILRPVGSKLSKLPSIRSETAQIEYLFTVKCQEKVENHVRVLLMQYLNNDETLLLRSLTSSDNGDPSIAIVTAEIRSISARDAVMEVVASRLTVEFGVIRVSWEVVGMQSDM